MGKCYNNTNTKTNKGRFDCGGWNKAEIRASQVNFPREQSRSQKYAQLSNDKRKYLVITKYGFLFVTKVSLYFPHRRCLIVSEITVEQVGPQFTLSHFLKFLEMTFQV